jgi:CDGSH-type Zn-finger protein
MADPIPAQKAPFPVDVEAGKQYWWCRCGRSQKQPYCDGSHKAFGLEPLMFAADATKTVYLCGCKSSKNQPFCDGTHKTL